MLRRRRRWFGLVLGLDDEIVVGVDVWLCSEVVSQAPILLSTKNRRPEAGKARPDTKC
jgi:hypothetical protein